MKSIIHLGMNPSQYPDGAVERVTAMARDHEILVTTKREDIEQHLERIEIAYGRFPHNLLTAAPALKWLQQEGAGADWLERYPDVKTAGFTLTNASGVHAIPISEHLLGMLLAIHRDLHGSIRAQAEGKWLGFGGHGVDELAGLTVMILGTGAIGERFARLCSALDMTVVGIRRDPAVPCDGISRMVGPDDLERELPHADVVANTLPLTSETRNILSRRRIDLMKDGSVILNIGRGGTVDEAALIDALKAGRLKGAGLDVFETEPLPADSPLWQMPQVIMTSHYAGETPHYNKRAFEIFTDNLERYLRDEALRNVVDKVVGY